MPETTADERARVLGWVAAYAHIKDHWQQAGRPLTDEQRESFATARAAQWQHRITDAEVDTFRREHQDYLDMLAANQA